MGKNKQVDSRGRKQKITDAQIKKAHAAGMNHVEIAKSFDVSLQTTRRRFKALGLKIKDTRGKKPSGRINKMFSILPETKEKVDTIADKTRTPKGIVVEKAIDLYFKQLNL